jgi:hypothetical protein
VESQGAYFEGDQEMSSPRYATFFSWPKVGYFLDRVVYKSNKRNKCMRNSGAEAFGQVVVLKTEKMRR